MNDLQNLNLIELLPTSIASDETIRNICNAIAEKLQTINEKAELVLLLPRLDQLPETLVDELAWQYHVDFYDYAADINKKRALVRKAIDWHRRKGTPAAVEEVCTAVFKSAKVYENWEYGGKPYHFQVRMISEGIPDKSVLDNLYRAIKESKNVRSWLDALSFDRQIAGSLFVGGVYSSMRNMEIFPSQIKPQILNINNYFGAAIYVHKGVEVTCQTGQI